MVNRLISNLGPAITCVTLGKWLRTSVSRAALSGVLLPGPVSAEVAPVHFEALGLIPVLTSADFETSNCTG